MLWFERQADVPVDAASRSFTLPPLHPDSLLTLASLDRGQQHGGFAGADAPPPRAPFPPSHVDSFAAGYADDSMPA